MSTVSSSSVAIDIKAVVLLSLNSPDHVALTEDTWTCGCHHTIDIIKLPVNSKKTEFN